MAPAFRPPPSATPSVGHGLARFRTAAGTLAALACLLALAGTAAAQGGVPAPLARPAVQLAVGGVLVLAGGATALFADRVLWLAWAFSAGLRPREDAEYAPLSWFVRATRIGAGLFALVGAGLLAAGALGGALG